MPRKRNDIAPVSDAPAEDFSLSQPSPNPSVEPKAPRLGAYIPLTADGQIDEKRIRPSQKESFDKAVAAIRAGAGSSSSAVSGEVQFITEKHVAAALSYYGKGCAYVIPNLINSRLPEGKLPISRDLAIQVYSLTKEQIEMLTPDGVEFLNQQFSALPQWIKDLVLAVGPGAKFLGGLAVITAMNTQSLIAQWEKMQPSSIATEQKVNGGLATDVEGADKDVLN